MTAPALTLPRRSVAIPRSRREVWRWLGLLPAVIVVGVAIFGPLLEPHNPIQVVGQPSLAPGGAFLMGTDSSGLDVLSRVVAATRTDVVIALLAAAFSTTIGLLIGIAIGMAESHRGFSGVVARVVARGLDLMQAIPAVVVGLAMVAFYGASRTVLIVAITVILIPIQSRLVRTEVLKVRGDAYLDAARMAGSSEISLTFRHVLPNSSWPALENASVMFGVAVILTAALGFLGVGLPPPTPEWGSMISRGSSDAAVGRWWSFAFPAIALVFTVSAAASASALFLHRRDD